LTKVNMTYRTGCTMSQVTIEIMGDDF